MKISKKVRESIVGQEIVKVCYEDSDDIPVIYLKNGVSLAIFSDPEANGPGFVQVDGDDMQAGF
jgi:hypothetical protein